MDFQIEKLFLVGLIPGMIALVVFVVAWRPWMKDQPLWSGYWSGALAGVASYAFVYVMNLGLPTFPPVGSKGWLLYLSVGSLLAGICDSAICKRRWLVHFIHFIIAVAIPLCILYRVLDAGRLEVGLFVIWIAGISVFLYMTWLGLNRVTDTIRGPVMPFILCLVFGTMAVMSFDYGNASTGELSLGLLTVVSAGFLVALWNRKVSLTRGAVSVLVYTMGSLLFTGYFFAEFNPTMCVLLMLTPLLPGLTRVPLLNKLAGRKRLVLYLCLVLPPLLIVLWMGYEHMRLVENPW